MAKQFVPQALIVKAAFPSGRRLPKRVAFKKPTPPPAILSRSPHPSFPNVYVSRLASGVTNTRPRVGLLSDGTWGNLVNDEFVYWVGHCQPSSSYVVCRCCGDHKCWSVALRKGHQASTNCRQLIDQVVAELRKSPNCALCNLRTFRTKWRIPLCCDKCEDAWRLAQCPAFTRLLDSVKKQVAK